VIVADVAAAAQLACLLEASAPKPGNVSPGRHFDDLRYEDFLAAAAAIGEPLTAAGVRPLGMTIRLATEATRRWAGSNVNLGIVLLLAPLVRAALRSGVADVRSVRGVLDETTVEDAREVYVAIRLAAPGGLGRAESQDVASEPDQTLVDVMRLAADRDGIAREYATGFDTTFTIGAPAVARARRDGLEWNAACRGAGHAHRAARWCAARGRGDAAGEGCDGGGRCALGRWPGRDRRIRQRAAGSEAHCQPGYDR
jgi:triphosphoribosyl-dephospho-CoA synthase